MQTFQVSVQNVGWQKPTSTSILEKAILILRQKKVNSMAKLKIEKPIGVLVDLFEGSAVKFVAHRVYDALLCNHVYMRFCQNCSQYKCKKRKV